jgi:hypothetical protein
MGINFISGPREWRRSHRHRHSSPSVDRDKYLVDRLWRGPETVTADLLATKQQRFQDVEGRCEACGELIGDGTDWRRAIYYHRRLASDPNVSDKEARSATNCMVLHPACHDDPVEFYNWHDEMAREVETALCEHGRTVD